MIPQRNNDKCMHQSVQTQTFDFPESKYSHMR